jgi:hypothetical protein
MWMDWKILIGVPMICRLWAMAADSELPRLYSARAPSEFDMQIFVQ